MQAFGGVYFISSLIFCFRDSPFRLIAMILVRNRDKAIVNSLLQWLPATRICHYPEKY